ncbi:hypothetical protein QQA16_28635, partial [Klebsiella pneumoniae]|uniref:hypothetical protein n=1 Tax=Klebsiella pneumoniae TaxID=573 RepID=UPI0029494F72
SAILWKPPAHSPEENMVRQKCSGIRRSYLETWRSETQKAKATLCHDHEQHIKIQNYHLSTLA